MIKEFIIEGLYKNEKGNILILSQNKEKTLNVKNIIKIKKKYELEVFELDSIKLLQNDSSWKVFNFAVFGRIRGGYLPREIYVKYNYFAHYNIVEKLIEERIEPVVPQLLDFFMQLFVNFDIEDKYGIRIENLTLVVDEGEGMFGNYYSFETVTLCPIDKTPIVKALLNEDEIAWLNNYHKKVYELISPSLNDDERNWLREATSEL